MERCISKRPILIFVSIVVAILAIAFVRHYFTSTAKDIPITVDENTTYQAADANEIKQASETVAPPENVVSVRVVKSTAEDKMISISVMGETKAHREVVLKAETSGRVERVLVKQGSTVFQDDVLLELVMGNRPAKLKEAQALLEQKKLALNAIKNLSQKGFKGSFQLAEAEADYEAAIANVKAIELDISHTKITAPFYGIFDSKTVEVGNFVDVGDEIGRIVDLNPALVIARVTEQNVKQITVGAPGYARFIDGRKLEGRVRFVGSVSDEQTRTFPVELEIPNENGQIVQGMTAEMIIPLSQAKAHKITPSIVSLSDEGVLGVKIVDKEHKVRFMPITIVEDQFDGFWVTGLPEEALIITVGQEFVIDGQIVSTSFSE